MPLTLAYSANAYRRYSLEEAIERIARLGYAGIELMADRPHLWPADADQARVEQVRRKLAGAGLSISNVNAFMTTAIEDFWHPSWIEPDRAYRRERVEHTRRALALARQLGAASITTEPGGPLPKGLSFQAAMDTFVEGLKPVLEQAEGEGVLLLVEPEPGLLIENAEQFEELAARIDSPAFGLNFDVGHFYCVGEPLGASIRRLAGYIRHFHIEDIASSRVHEHLIPGRGAIDFTEVFDAARQIGYGGWMTVELYPYLDDPDAAGREAAGFLRRCLPPP